MQCFTSSEFETLQEAKVVICLVLERSYSMTFLNYFSKSTGHISDAENTYLCSASCQTTSAPLLRCVLNLTAKYSARRGLCMTTALAQKRVIQISPHEVWLGGRLKQGFLQRSRVERKALWTVFFFFFNYFPYSFFFLSNEFAKTVI